MFAFIEAEKASSPVTVMCRLLGVSTSGYYTWRSRPPSARSHADHALSQQICVIHERSRGTYGMPRVWAELRYEGVYCSRKRVARLLRRAGLQGCHRRKGPRTTRRRPEAAPAPDLVKRRFAAAAPDQLWVADITYVSTWMGFLYLAVVLDAYSRRVVGWAMAEHVRTELVVEAVEMALWRRRPSDGVIHHSDRGSQYTSLAFGRRLRDAGMMASMGSRGTVSTTRWRRASSPRSIVNCSPGSASRPGTRRDWRSSTISKGSTTHIGGTRRSTTCHPQHTKGDGQSSTALRSLSLSTKPG